MCPDALAPPLRLHVGRRLFAFALVLIAFLFCGSTHTARAANFDGDGNSGGFGYFDWWNNWFGDTFPTWNYATDLEFNFRNQAGITNVYNNAGWLQAKNIVIQSTFSGSVTFGGNGSSGINFKEKIENYSSSAQTFSMDLSGGKDGSTRIELNPINGDLTFTGNFYNDDSDDYFVYGANSKTLTLSTTLGVGSTAANVDFSLEQASNVQINNNQSWAGTTYVKAGTMTVASTRTLATGTLNISGGTFTNAGADVLGNSSVVTMSGGSFNMGGNDTVGSFTITGGTLGGSSTLTATSYSLGGGTINGNLGSGAATNSAGSTSLNGTLGSTNLVVSGGTITLGNSNRMSDTLAATVSGGTLNLGGFTDTVGSFTISSGTFTNGTLTAASYSLGGGTVGGTLGSGAATNTGTTSLTGVLNSTNLVVSGGTITLGSANRMSDTLAATVSGGTLNLGGFTDTVGSFTISSGTFTNGTLTAASYSLGGGTVGGTLGSGAATNTGTTSLTGTLNSTNLVVSGGTITLGSADRMSDTLAATVSGGTLNLGGFTDTVGSFTISSGTFTNGTLTAGSYALQGGTVAGVLGAGGITVSSGTTILQSAGRLNSASSLTINSGQLTMGGNETVASLAGSAGTLALNGANTLTVGGGNTSTSFAGAITGASGGLTKTGTGTLTLSGTSTYSGATTVSGGTLAYTGTNTSTATTVGSGGTLIGSGSLGNVTVSSGGTINPGLSPGTLSVSNLVWAGGGNYNWQVYNAAGTAGATNGYDLILGNSLNITATTNSKFSINLWSLSGIGPDVNGNAINFTNTNSYNWTIGTFTNGITNFSAGVFSINTGATNGTTGFSNSFTGSFTLTTNSTNIILTYTAPAGSYDVTVGTNTAANQGAAQATNSVAQFTGASALNKLGAGTLIMTNSLNDYTGVTTIKQGTIQINVNAPSGSAGALGNAITAVLVGDSSTNLAAGFNFGVANVTNSRDLTVVAGTGAADRTIGTTIGSGTAVQVGGIALNTNANFSVASGGTLSVSGGISGTGLLTKIGTGTLTLTGGNTYSGGTLVSAGTLVGNTTGLQGVITNNSAVIFDQSTNGTYAGAMSGTGTLSKTSAGTLTLSASNSYSGGTAINQGGIVVGNNFALGTGAVTNFADGGSLSSDGSARAISNQIVLTNNMVIGGTGAFTISGDVTQRAVSTITNLNAGGVTLSNVVLSFNNTGRTLTIAGTGATTIAGIVSNGGTGAGGLTINSSGVTTLNGNNTYTGTTTVGSSGFLVLGNNNALGSTVGGTVISAGGGTIDLNGMTIGAETLTLRSTGAGGNGALRNSSASAASWAGNVTLATASTIAATNGAITISGAIDAANLALTITNEGAVTLSGAITNSTSTLTKSGTGTLTLSGANTFSGGMTLSAGTLSIGNDAALGTGAATFADGVAVNSDSTARNVTNNISFQNLQIGGTGALTLSGTLTHTRAGPSTLTNNNAGGLSLGNINLSSSATVSRTLTFAGTGNTTVTGVIADGTNAAVTNSQIVLNASGTTLTLSGANTYRGLSTITAGTLLAANSAALGATNNGTTVANGATLALSNNINSAEAITIAGDGVGGNGVIRNISGNNTNSGTITLNATNNRIQVDSGTSLTLGAIANGVSTNNLTLSANGTLRVTGALTGAGTSAVLQKDGAGSLVISNSGTTGQAQLQLGGGTVTVEQGSFSTSTSTGTRALDIGISSTGDSTNNVAFYANSGVTISNSIYIAPNTTNNALRILGTESTSGTATFDREIFLGGNLTVSAASGGTALFSGNIVSSGNLTKTNAGTVVLSGSNTFTGNVDIAQGTLVLSNSLQRALNDANAVSISNGATLSVGLSEEVGSITGASGSFINLNGVQLRAGDNNASTTFAGVMSSTADTASFVKKGTGTTTLTAANTMNGQTFIDAGTLRFDVAQGGTFTNTINVGLTNGSAAATLAIGAGGVTLSNAINVRSGNSGTMTIAALNTNGTATFSGNITLNKAVTLSANAGGNLSLGAIAMGDNNVTYSGANNVTISGAMSANSGTAELRVNGSGTLALTGDNSASNQMKIILNSGTLSVGALSAFGTTPGALYFDKINFNGGTLSVTNDITIAADTMGITSSGSGGTIDVAANKTFTQNSTVLGNAGGTFNKTGAGTLVLGNSANGFNPTINIQAGAVQVTNIAALGTNVTAIGLGTASTSGTFRYMGTSGSFNDTITIGAAGGTIDVAAAALGTTLTNSGIVSGGALTKAGDSILVLSGNNTYTNTVISGGMLTVTADTNLGTAPGAAANNITIGNGRLGLNGNFTVNANRGILLTDANSTIDVYGGNSATVAGIITNTGSGALTKLGTGSLILTGANTYTGNTIVGAGVLRATTGNSLGAAGTSVTVSNGATLQLSNATGFTTDRVLTLSGNGNVSGALLNLGGANTNSGGITLAANSIIGASGGSLVLSGNITNGGNSLTLDTYGAAGIPLNISGAISGNGGLTKIGGGTAVLSGANTYAGGALISAGTLQIGNGGSTGQLGGGNVTNNSALDFNRTGELSVSNTISGTGTMAKAGAGTVTLTGANTFSGGVTVNGGTLALNRTGGAALGGSNAITINTNGTLRTDAAGQIVGAPLVTVNSGGTYNLNGFNQTNALVGEGSVTLGAGTLNISNTVNDTFSGVISGGGGVTKTGAGTQILSGSNTYTGSTVLSNGVLRLGGTGTTIAGNVTIAGGTLNYSTTVNNQIATNATMTVTGGTFELGPRTQQLASLDMSGGLISMGSGTITLGGASSITGGSVSMTNTSTLNTTGLLTLGTTTIESVYNAATTNTGIVLGGDITVNASATASLAKSGTAGVRMNLGNTVRTFEVGSGGHLLIDWGVFSTTPSAGGITKTGDGTLTLNQATTFTGGTTLSSGVLRVGNDNALGGTVSLNGGTIASTDGTARTFANALNLGGDVTFGQASGGTGALTFSSTATNNLGGGNRTLTTTVNTKIDGAIGNGSISKAGAGTLTLSNASSSFGDLAISAGRVAFQTNATITGLSGSGGDLAISGGTLTVNASTNSTFGQVISGAGGLSKTGSGTLTLSGGNSFAGTTLISGGTLAVNGTNTGSPVVISNGGTLGGTGLVAATTIQSGGLISPGNSIGTLSVETLTIEGNSGYIWEVADVTGSAGIDYDRIVVGGGTGNVSITATSLNPFTIYLTSYTGFTNWNPSSTYTWNLIDWGTVTGFEASAFTVNTNDFTGAIAGTFTFADSGGFLVMTYTSGTPTYTNGAGNWSEYFDPELLNGNNAIFAGAAGGAATNNISTNTVASIGNLTFSNTAGAFTLSANSGSAGFDTASRLLVGGNIVNDSANAQTISLALGFDAERTIDAAAGDMTFGGTISNGVGLIFTGASNNTVSGVISGAGAIAKTGSGTLVLSGANNYTGATTISNGVLQLGNATALGTTAAGTTVISGATLDLNGQAVTGEALALAGTGVGGNGALINSSASAASLSGAVTLTGNSTVGTTGNMSLSGGISGAFSLTKIGTATLTLSGNSGYSGGTIINAGSVLAGNNNAFGTGTITLNGGGIGATGAIRTLANNLVASGDFFIGGGGSGTVFNGNFDLGGSRVITFSNNATFNGVVSNGGLTINAASLAQDITFTASNTYTGPTIINGGDVNLTGAGALFSGGAVDITASVGNSQLHIGAITADSTTIGSLSASNSANAKVLLDTKTLIAGGNNGSTAFGGIIEGTGGFTKDGTGTMTFTRASTYTGATTISNGEIALSGAGALANSSAINLAGVTARYDISGKTAASETNGSLAGVAGSVVNLGTNKTLNVGGANNSTTFAGILTNTGSLTKSGSGTMTLSGANTFSGGSTLSAGVLRAAHGSALGTGALVASEGTTLEITNGVTIANNMSVYTVKFLDGGNTLSGTITNNNSVYDVASGTTNTVSGFITGDGGLELIGGGTLNITGATNNYGGATVISNGTLQISTLANAGSVSSIGTNGTVELDGATTSAAVINYTGGSVSTDRTFALGGGTNGGGTLRIDDAGATVTATGSVTGEGTFVVDGPGTLVLSNTTANQFNPDAIQVNSGATLVLGANEQFGNSTGLILNGGTFLVGALNLVEDLGTLTLSASSTIDFGAYGNNGFRRLTFDDSSTISWTGTLTITNWQGVALTSSDFTEIVFGVGGLTSTQLGQIRFANQDINGGALIGGGELVPVPEPRVYAAAVALLAVVGWRERKRLLGLLGKGKKPTA